MWSTYKYCIKMTNKNKSVVDKNKNSTQVELAENKTLSVTTTIKDQLHLDSALNTLNQKTDVAEGINKRIAWALLIIFRARERSYQGEVKINLDKEECFIVNEKILKINSQICVKSC